MTDDQQQNELDDIRSRLIQRADSDPTTHVYIKNEFALAYNAGDLELLRAFDSLFVPGSTLDTTSEYVAQLRHVDLKTPLETYFTHRHKVAFSETAFALQVASGSRVFNSMHGYEVMEEHAPDLPVLRAALDAPERHELLVALIKSRGVKDPRVLVAMYREMCDKPLPFSDGTL